jgi:hypothetical protein
MKNAVWWYLHRSVITWLLRLWPIQRPRLEHLIHKNSMSGGPDLLIDLAPEQLSPMIDMHAACKDDWRQRNVGHPSSLARLSPYLMSDCSRCWGEKSSLEPRNAVFRHLWFTHWQHRCHQSPCAPSHYFFPKGDVRKSGWVFMDSKWLSRDGVVHDGMARSSSSVIRWVSRLIGLTPSMSNG